MVCEALTDLIYSSAQKNSFNNTYLVNNLDNLLILCMQS